LVALIRRACGIDEKLTPFSDTIRRNFQTWIMGKHAGIPTERKFTEAQTAWLQLIRDHIITSLRFERDDLDFAPFDAQGGLGKMHQLFGDQMDGLIEELNGELVA
jgi:type I restriction enzyme R subunit